MILLEPGSPLKVVEKLPTKREVADHNQILMNLSESGYRMNQTFDNATYNRLIRQEYDSQIAHFDQLREKVKNKPDPL
jgi:hypothetical protein